MLLITKLSRWASVNLSVICYCFSGDGDERAAASIRLLVGHAFKKRIHTSV